MEKVFADTGYWIALLNPHDDLHQRASAVASILGTKQIITSEMVLTEFLNSFSDFGKHLRQAAARAIESLRGSLNVVIIPQTTQLFRRALQRYEDMSDKTGV